MNNDDMPAMPIQFDYVTNADNRKIELFRGLTKREMFAMHAMQGLCANSIPGSHNTPGNVAKESVDYADALLEWLDK